MVLIMGSKFYLMDLPWSLAFLLHNEGWYTELRVYPPIKNGLSRNHSIVACNPIRLIIWVLASHLWGERRTDRQRQTQSRRDRIREGGESGLHKLQSKSQIQLVTPKLLTTGVSFGLGQSRKIKAILRMLWE